MDDGLRALDGSSAGWRRRPPGPVPWRPDVGAVLAAPFPGLLGTGAASDPVWAAAFVMVAGAAVVARSFAVPYIAGYLALQATKQVSRTLVRNRREEDWNEGQR